MDRAARTRDDAPQGCLAEVEVVQQDEVPEGCAKPRKRVAIELGRRDRGGQLSIPQAQQPQHVAAGLVDGTERVVRHVTVTHGRGREPRYRLPQEAGRLGIRGRRGLRDDDAGKMGGLGVLDDGERIIRPAAAGRDAQREMPRIAS